jgi:hypothetical protein
LLDLCHFDEPALFASINKRSLTSPAEWIRMLFGSLRVESSGSFQILDDLLVGILDIDSLVV